MRQPQRALCTTSAVFLVLQIVLAVTRPAVFAQTEIDLDSQTPLNKLTNDVISWCRERGSDAMTVRDVINDATVNDAIQRAINVYNRSSAISSAQHIQKWTILPEDFSIGGGELGMPCHRRTPITPHGTIA